MSATHEQRRLKRGDGVELHVESWHPDGEPKFVVVIAHGGAEHIGRYCDVARELADKGALVFGPDHRGQGLSGGARGNIAAFETYADDLDFVMRAMSDSLPEHQRPQALPWFVFGHSMGGLIATLWVLDHAANMPLRGVVLSAPLFGLAIKPPLLKLWAGKVAAVVRPSLEFPSGIPASALSRDPEQVQRYMSDRRRVDIITAGWFAALNRAMERCHREFSRITLPLLVYVGTDDRVVDSNATATLFSSLRAVAANDQHFEKYVGYFHELHNEPAELRRPVMHMLIEWLTRRSGMGSGPSPVARGRDPSRGADDR